MTKSMKAIRFNNRIIDAIENLRLLGAIDRKTENLIRLKINEVFSSIDSKVFPGSKFSDIQGKYIKEINRVFTGNPKYFGRHLTDLINVVSYLLARLEYERKGVTKLDLSFEPDRENTQIVSDYLNKICGELVVFYDVLEDFQYKLSEPEV